MLLAPPVPVNVMVPPPVVRIEPPVKEIPWHAPVVPVALALIEIKLFVPDAEMLAELANPIPEAPFPVKVAPAILPTAVKEAVIFTPFPPPAPAWQFAKEIGPPAMKFAPMFTACALVPVLLPEQFWKAIVPVTAETVPPVLVKPIPDVPPPEPVKVIPLAAPENTAEEMKIPWLLPDPVPPVPVMDNVPVPVIVIVPPLNNTP